MKTVSAFLRDTAPRSAEDPVLDDLERLADLLEQYFHPSNTGSCAPALGCGNFCALKMQAGMPGAVSPGGTA